MWECFILGALCSILRFLGKGKLSKEEAKVWEGEKGERVDLRQCVRAGSVTLHHVPSHTHISSPSHTLPSSLESFPSPKIRKMLHSQRQQCQYLGVVDSQQNTFAPNLRTVTSETGLWVKLNSSSNLLEPPWNTSESQDGSNCLSVGNALKTYLW